MQNQGKWAEKQTDKELEQETRSPRTAAREPLAPRPL